MKLFGLGGKKVTKKLVGLVLLGLLWGAHLYAEPVTWSLSLEDAKLRKGENGRLVVSATMEDGWYVYALQNAPTIPVGKVRIKQAPTANLLEADDDLKTFYDQNRTGDKAFFLTPWYETPAHLKEDKFFSTPLYTHLEKAKFYRNFAVPENFDQARLPVELEVFYQACNNRICLPVRKATLVGSLDIEAGPARAEKLIVQKTVELPPTQASGAFWGETLLAKTAVGWLLLCFLAGLVALGTPCALPVLPLILHYFSAQGSQQKETKPSFRFLLFRHLGLSGLFLLGVLLVYSISGLVLYSLLGPFGLQNFASHAIINWVAGGLFLIFGLALLGLVRLRTPAFVQTKIERFSRSSNPVVSSIFIGSSFTLTSFACNMPIVGALLVSAASFHLSFLFAGLLAYALGFSLPLAVFFFVPQLFLSFKKISLAGWQVLPIFIGVLELMVAVRFFVNADMSTFQVLSRDVVLGVYIALSLLAVLLIARSCWRHLAAFKQSLKWNSLLFGGSSLLFIALAIFFSRGFDNYTLGSRVDALLPPVPLDQEMKGGDFVTATPENQLKWYNSKEEAFQAARRQNKPVFVNFTGYTCTNCRWMESYVFRLQKVHQSFQQGFILLVLHTDLGEDALKNQEWQLNAFQTVALPLYAVLSPEGEILRTKVGTSPENEFLAFLQQPASLASISPLSLSPNLPPATPNN